MITGVIFCDSDNLVARGIKAVTESEMSHCALLFDDEIVLHYRFMGFETMHIMEFEAIYQIKKLLKPKEAIFASSATVTQRHNKKPYDFFGMLYVGLHLGVLSLTGYNLPGINYLEAKRKRFCVEFCAEVLLGESGSLMTPEALYRLLISRGYHEGQ